MITNAIEQARHLYEYADGIMICDKHGYVEYVEWSDGNYMADEVFGMHITEVYPELTEQTSTIMLALQTGLPRYDERQVIHSCKGDLLDVVSSTIPLFMDGEVVGAMNATIFYERYKQSKQHSSSSREELYVLDDIISQDPTMIALKERCTIIASNDSPVLLYGETGTGKELFAQSLHTCSRRAGKPFVSQNCAAIPQSLLEGIFFGVEKGSFTGAETRKGLFELADGGTLFLDEINSMDLAMQAKLLKVIEEQQVRRLGGTKTHFFNTRIICAMNQEPMEVLKTGKMREDLFYRISVVRIDIPPLRNRKKDIMILTDYFIKQFNRKMHKNILGVSELVRMTFESYDWRGNVRELRNTLEGSFSFCTGSTINMIDIPNLQSKLAAPQDLSGSRPRISDFYDETLTLSENVAAYERKIILRTLEQNGNHVSAAARRLGLSRQALSYKMEKYGIEH